MRIIILFIIFFIFLINSVSSANNSFNKEVNPSSDIFDLVYLNDFDGKLIYKQNISIFGTEQTTVSEITINNSKAEFIFKRNENPSMFVDQDYDKIKLIMRFINNSLEVENLFTAKNHSSNWKKFRMPHSEKKLVNDVFNTASNLIGSHRVHYQKRILKILF